MTETPKPPAKDENGRFLNGNNGGPGRPKGSSRKELAREFIESMHKAWAKHGDDVLEDIVKSDPATFLRSMVAIMPKELDVNITRYDEMTDDQLKSQFIAALREARALGIDIGPGEPSSLH